ncbi:putative fungal-specific transcription factor [Fusarium acuminatum]|uniref:Fungal-specific transcription factor n=1 Tax=Fusarium acuminatum TaxID=5515 RepID=A0ABZ2WFE4_9HYPO
MYLLHPHKSYLYLPTKAQAKGEATARLHIRDIVSIYTRPLVPFAEAHPSSERKIDHIAQKLEEFGNVLGAIQNHTQNTIPATTPLQTLSLQISTSSTAPKSETTSTSSIDRLGSELLTPSLDHQGESSLSAQATFANKYLEDAIINKPNGIDIAAEMSSVLESLRIALGRNSNQQEHDYLYPHARALASGLNLRNLPMPPVDKVLNCLRMTKENARVRFFWTHEETSFSNYFLNVYSPTEATHAGLIIVNAGLYWMFQQCKHAVIESNKKADFEAQAIICRDNLETVLTNLPFHQPSKLETVSSLIMASLYCLETCKPSAAWGFVATASQMSQTLGMHSKVETAQDPPEIKAVKIKLFWLLYVQEKALSLRLGRSSTIRDSDITIPVPYVDSLSEITYFSQLDRMKDLAHLQGKIYDQLYSSGALAQPQDVRSTRARSLAAELEVHKSREGRNEKLYIEALRQATSNRFVEAFLCTGEVINSSLICLVYRAIPPEANQGTIFGKECISSAHKALKAHRQWMSLVTELDDDFLESYVNIVIKTLESATHSIPSSGVRKEYRLFKALYDAACSYIQARLSTVGFEIHPSEIASSPSAMLFTAHQQPVTLTPLSNLQGSQMSTRMSLDEAAQWTPDSFETPSEVDVDQYGAQLGNWLHMNNQITRALEDSYFWEDLL